MSDQNNVETPPQPETRLTRLHFFSTDDYLLTVGIKNNVSLGIVMIMFCQEAGISLDEQIFTHNEQTVGPADTVQSLNLHDDDVIYVSQRPPPRMPLQEIPLHLLNNNF